jgi:tetratricopeptide (TPR) repeat protein
VQSHEPAAEGNDPNESTATRVKSWLKDQGYNLLGRDYFCGVGGVDLDLRTDITPALSRLADLPGVEYLSLDDALDRDLRAVGRASDLRTLELDGSGLTDEGLQHLSRLRRLAYLYLGGNQGVTDEGLKALSGLSQLELLDLSGTRVHDEGLRHLRGLKMLSKLDLTCTPVTDAAIDDIVALPALKQIFLIYTGLTADGVAKLEARRPKLVVHYSEQDDFDVTSELVRAGLWKQALEKLESAELDCYPYESARMLGECHAALGLLDRAEADYVQAFELAPTPDRTPVHVSSTTIMASDWQMKVWTDLCTKPALFERVAQHYPDDPVRWAASAWRRIRQGRWGEAADDYRRAVEHSKDDRFDLHYSLAQLAAGDVRGQQSFIKKRFSTSDDEGVLAIEPHDYDEWMRAAQLWLYSPQGTIRVPGLFKWVTNEVAREWRRCGLGPLAVYRLEEYENVCDCGPPDRVYGWEYCGRFWFARAMAHQRLGDAQQARHCYARAVRWVERIGEFANLRPDTRLVDILLEAEVLRREAESLIFASVPPGR